MVFLLDGFWFLVSVFFCFWIKMDKVPCRTSGFDWPRAATSLLIQLYEQNPCLYITTSADYHNRNKRYRALQNIVSEFNKKNLTNLTIDDIKKKIHGLRTQFLAEMQKIRKSEMSGSSTDTIYTPKLWCYEELLFLQQGAAVVSKGTSNLPSGIEENDSEGLPESQALETEILFDGDVTQLSDASIDVFSSSSSRDQFQENSRAPSREDCSRGPSREDFSTTPKGFTISSQHESKTLKRKRSSKIGESVTDKQQVTSLLESAVTTLHNFNKPEEEVQPLSMKHRLFAEFIAEEMEALEDEDIIDEFKSKVLNLLYDAKKQQREKKIYNLVCSFLDR